jgi:catechol 2,3-dioxygenase-like lactoylglutathione lyase family enzyme
MLYVKDFARMRDFYASVLQAPPINTEWTDTWALFDAGGTQFALHAEGMEMSTPLSTRASNREQSPIKLIFAVGDVPAERARLGVMGITTLQRSWQEPAESCDCVDPEGNVFQIAAHVRLPNRFGRVSSVVLAIAAIYAAAQAQTTPAPQQLNSYLNAIGTAQTAARVQKVAAIHTRAEADQRQAEVRSRILKSIGGLPERAGPVRVKQFATVSGEGFHIENIAL